MDSTSEECKDVYAHFGLAMYMAQCVEQSIIQLLIFLDFFENNVAAWESEGKWSKDFELFEKAISKKTMGRLMGNLKGIDSFSHLLDDNLEGLLDEALDKRNWLAHAYFSDRATHFVNSSGREEMIAELKAIRGLFKHIEDQLNPITYALSEKYGLTEKFISELTQKLTEIGISEVSDEDFKRLIKEVSQGF